MTSDVLSALRAGTRDAHGRLERGLALADAPLTRPRYAAVLERFLGFYEPLEELLDTAGARRVLDDWDERGSKAQWLDSDLRELRCTTDDLAALPRCRDLPAMRTPNEVLGCLYVLEGATLGGAIIAHRLREHGGLPHRFFRNYGAARPAMWRRFRSALVATVHGGAAIHEAVDAARATFSALQAWSEQETAARTRAQAPA